MVPAKRTQLKILTALVAGSVAMGCGSDDGNSPGNGSNDSGTSGGSEDGGTGGEGNNALTLTFSPMYSAYGGTHTYKLPVKVEGASGDLDVTTDPAGFVESEPYADGVMLTMKKAGTTTVKIKDKAGNTGSAELNVTAVTDDDWTTGKDRYSNGVSAFTLPEGGIQLPEGGFQLPEGGINLDAGLPMGFDSGITRNANSACSSCHTSAGGGGARMLPDGGMVNIDVEHTPQQTGGYSDETLINIFTMGKKPMGAPYRVLRQPIGGTGITIPEFIARMIYEGFHKWDVPANEQKGIVAYLRSLEPKSQPMVDFGGLLPPRGMTPAGGGGTPDAGTPDAGTP
jgi:hypothetical protein